MKTNVKPSLTEVLKHNQDFRIKQVEHAANSNSFTIIELINWHESVYQMLLEFTEYGNFMFKPRIINRHCALDRRLWLNGSPHTNNTNSNNSFFVSMWDGNIDKSPPCFLSFDIKGNKNRVTFNMRKHGNWGKSSMDFIEENFAPLFIKDGEFNHLIQEDESNDLFYSFFLGSGEMDLIAEKFIHETWPTMNKLVIDFATTHEYEWGMIRPFDKKHFDVWTTKIETYYN